MYRKFIVKIILKVSQTSLFTIHAKERGTLPWVPEVFLALVATAFGQRRGLRPPKYPPRARKNPLVPRVEGRAISHARSAWLLARSGSLGDGLHADGKELLEKHVVLEFSSIRSHNVNYWRPSSAVYLPPVQIWLDTTCITCRFWLSKYFIQKVSGY